MGEVTLVNPAILHGVSIGLIEVLCWLNASAHKLRRVLHATFWISVSTPVLSPQLSAPFSAKVFLSTPHWDAASASKIFTVGRNFSPPAMDMNALAISVHTRSS